MMYWIIGNRNEVLLTIKSINLLMELMEKRQILMQFFLTFCRVVVGISF